MTERQLPGLAGIYIGSGVSERTHQGFCHVTCQMRDGSIAEAQLTPAEVRKMALDWLEVAEAAIHDAAVFNMLRDELGVDEKRAALFIGELRKHREDAGTMEDVPGEGET